MDLYKVTLRAKQIITSYDSKGSPTGTREEFREQVYRDCPISLVNTYKTKFPDAFVGYEREIPEPQRRDGKRDRFAGGGSKRQGRSHAASERREAPMHADDMAEAVSRAVAREAA